jgi:pilus assembly protein Flp/PilA
VPTISEFRVHAALSARFRVTTFTSLNLRNLRLRKAIFASGISPRNLKGCELKRIFLKFLANESGATAIEYCLIAAFIALVIITIVNALGINIVGELAAINSSLK